MPENYRVVLARVLGGGFKPHPHQVWERVKFRRYLYVYPQLVGHKPDPCPGLSEAPGTLVASVLLIPDSIQMDSFDSWVSNPKENNGPLMSVVTWCLVSVAGAFLAVRLWIRSHHGQLWIDDCTLVASWVRDGERQGNEHMTDIV